MKNIEIVDELRLRPETRAVVIGGGVLGTMAGIELTKLNIGGVELFDEGGERASDAAGAQFLPLATGVNPTLSSLERELLPTENAYFPCVLQGFRESHDFYTERALQPGTGITEAPLMELRGPDIYLGRYLLDLMDANSYDLEPRTLEGAEGKPIVYNGYYACRSFSIDAPTARARLQNEFMERGGIVHENKRVTRQAVTSLDTAFAVVAAGSKSETIRRKISFPIYKKAGMSATYRTDSELPTLPMLSYDDIVFRPHADRHGITIGGLNLDNYGGDREEATVALERRLRDVEEPIGPWEGLPLDALKQGSRELRFGVRAVGAFGLTVEQDSLQHNIFHIEGGASLGWSLAPWAARLAARFVGEANENFTPGILDDRLLEKTGDPEIPYTVRTSMHRRKTAPSVDLLEFRTLAMTVDQTMAKIALVRAMESYLKAVRD